MENSKPLIIHLKKFFSWKTTYHKYPFYLAKAEPKRIYSYDQVFTEIFKTGTPPVNKGKGQHGWVRAVFGLEADANNNDVVIEGIGLIEKVGRDNYRLSDLAIEISQSYAHDPAGSDWKEKFAELIARSDIRTRVILYYIGILGYGLRFPNHQIPPGNIKSLSSAQLVSRGEKIDILSKVPSEEWTEGSRIYRFNQLLDRYRFEVLGPFLIRQIESNGLDLSHGIEYQGAKLLSGRGYRENPEPSISDLGSYLGQSLSLFTDLGVIVFDPSRTMWVINFPKAREIFTPEVTESLFADQRDLEFEKLLRDIYIKLADIDGYANVRNLRDQVCNGLEISAGESITYFNRQVARLISEGRLGIGKKMGWHATATDALFGDQNMEYVEFLF